MMLIDSPMIRRAHGSDFPAVDRLFSTAYPVLLAGTYSEEVCAGALPVIGRAQPELLRSGSFFLVLRGALLVGAGGWTQAAPGSGARTPGVGHVRHVVTHHNYQRQGIGRRLLDYIIGHAQGQGMRELSCVSTLNAEPFYAAMGFERQGPVTVPLPGGVKLPAVAMRARL
ncbi:GNAT family N-acetyltransferase [Roseivivax sp.]